MTTGTLALARLALRLDRVRLPLWVLLLGLMPAATAAQYRELYPTQESLDAVRDVITNPSLVALNGPLAGVSLGGLTAWKIGITELVLVALMSILTVVRHTRTEEETGRLELVGSARVGRYAPLTAALLVAGLANAAVGVVTALGLLGVGLPVAGSFALGSAIAVTGLVFAMVAAAAAQLTESARAATGIAIAVLGGAYLLRALGDSGPTWLSWASPLGWGLGVHSFAGDRWWVLGLGAALAAVLSVTAYALVGRRDLGLALLPDRPGPAVGAASLSTPWALAWRLHRGGLLGWTIGLAISGAVMGGAASSINDNVINNPRLVEILGRMGGQKGVTDAFLAAVFGIIGLVAAAYTVQATLRLRAEEAGGRAEPLLATAVSRLSWVVSHLAFPMLGTAVLLGAAGLGAGLAYGVQIGEVGGQVPRLVGAALVQLPAAWVLAGIGLVLFGLAPRWSAMAWAVLVACVVLLELGALLGLSQWLVDVSPFAHPPKLPGSTLAATPLLWLTGVTVVLLGTGALGFRRRNVSG